MLLRKMLRDMKANKTQFISIFLMSLLGVFVYAGINAEWYGMQKEIDKYYVVTNFPDYWVIGENLSSSDVAKAETISGVSATQLRLTIDGTAEMNGSPVIRLNIIDQNKLSTPYLIEGEKFDTVKDGIWLDETFAKAHNLKVGDQITVQASGIKLKKTILGLVMHPEYIYEIKDASVFTPDPETFGFAFLPRSSIPNAAALPNNELMVRLKSGADVAAVKAELEDQISGYSVILSRDTQVSPAQFKNEISQNKAMGGVFPVVFFLIAALTMLTTMTRITSGQRTQIGTLKALGFKRSKILRHYVSYGLWLGLAGGLIGLFTGPLVIPAILFSMQKAIYNLPEWYAAISVSDIFAVALAVACCGLSSYFVCRRELSDAPAETMRPRVPKAAKHTRWEKSQLWHRLGFSVQWNLRDILRSKVRSAMAIVGVIGCIALLLLALGLRDSVNSVTNTLYKDLYTYNTKINLKTDITDVELNALTNKYVGQLIQESSIELKSGDVEKSGSITVVGSGSRYNFEDKDGNKISLPSSGVAISYKMAQLLHVKSGDTIKWRVYGENSWTEAEITAVYRTPINQGIAVSQAAYDKMGYTMKPTALLCGEDGSAAVDLAGVESVQDKDALMASFNSILDSMQAVIAILILAAVILGVVVLYNLGTLSFTERTRELATLKVLGFPKRKIRSLLQKQNIWLTVLGIVVGIPAGYLLIGFMLATISESSDYVAYVSPVSLSVSIISTFLLSFFVNLLMSRKIKTIDMVSSLKSVE